MYKAPLATAIAEHVWRTHYRWCENGHMLEPSVEATWDRVALAVSSVEAVHRNEWRERFRAILGDFRFLPGGRILAGAGTPRELTLFNCFVTGTLEDSINGIFNALREAMDRQRRVAGKHVMLLGDMNLKVDKKDVYWLNRLLNVDQIIDQVKRDDNNNNNNSLPLWKRQIVDKWSQIEMVLTTIEVRRSFLSRPLFCFRKADVSREYSVLLSGYTAPDD